MDKSDRITVRFNVPSHWQEGHLLKFLQNDPGLNFKEALLRALRAYYLPEAFAGQLEPDQFQRMVEATVSDLQYRALQLQLRYCPERPLPPFHVLEVEPQLALQQSLPPTETASTRGEEVVPTTIAHMREQFAGIDVNHFLDDF